MFALELDAISKRFGNRYAVSEMRLAVEPGACFGLLGPNGAGKTTTLRLLLGFTRPTSGSVRLRGRSPTNPESRVGLGYLPERLGLPGRMKVAAFVHHHAVLAGLPARDRGEEVERVLSETGILDRASDRIGDLSKGLRQRVGFAQALLGRPELLILDEPTSGLDPIGVRDARGWIHDAKARGATVLLSSHVLSEVERSCDRVAILDAGRITASGAVDEIVREGEDLEDAFVRILET